MSAAFLYHVPKFPPLLKEKNFGPHDGFNVCDTQPALDGCQICIFKLKKVFINYFFHRREFLESMKGCTKFFFLFQQTLHNL